MRRSARLPVRHACRREQCRLAIASDISFVTSRNRVGVSSAEFVQSTAEAGGIRNAYQSRETRRRSMACDDRRVTRCIDERVCVVSIGTAATIDGVDATGRHLGGVIVPGPDLMVDSLLQEHERDRAAQLRTVRSVQACSRTTRWVRFDRAPRTRSLRWSSGRSSRCSSKSGEQPTLVHDGRRERRDRCARPRVPHVVTPDLCLRGRCGCAQARQIEGRKAAVHATAGRV